MSATETMSVMALVAKNSAHSTYQMDCLEQQSPRMTHRRAKDHDQTCHASWPHRSNETEQEVTIPSRFHQEAKEGCSYSTALNLAAGGRIRVHQAMKMTLKTNPQEKMKNLAVGQHDCLEKTMRLASTLDPSFSQPQRRPRPSIFGLKCPFAREIYRHCCLS